MASSSGAAPRALLQSVRAMLQAAYNWVLDWLAGMGQLALFAKEVFLAAFAHRSSGRTLLYQLYFIGVK